MTVDGSSPDVPPEFAEHCHVVRARPAQATAQHIRSTRPDAIVFDYDYPDRMSLGMAVKVKEESPSVPMVLLTVQHSEALAVWAFRSRFFDFLVRPVIGADVERCLGLLEEIAAERRTQEHRHAPVIAAAIPMEVPAAMGRARALQPAIQFVENNLGSRIVAEEMARLCLMTPFRFSRAFREAFGVTFREYVMRMRLTEAARRLENPQVPVAQVAYAVGFNDMSHFSRLFKREFGKTPSAAQAASRSPRPALAKAVELPALESTGLHKSVLAADWPLKTRQPTPR
jgi:AraC-like DNA-binding protein